MNIYLIIILVVLIGQYLITVMVDRLNVRHASPILPEEFQGYYDAEKYQKSQQYLKENTNFEILQKTIMIVITLALILAGGFNVVDQIARSFGYGDIVTGLIFAGILVLAIFILGLPFAVYDTFVIEEKYGFNKTTAKTFILDTIKGIVLGAILGGIVFTIILWFFGQLGPWAWVCCWAAVTVFQLFLTLIAPVVILPLFNKFTALEEGELKSKIEAYAEQENYKLKGLYKIDASKRSTKTNAYFTGLGKYKRIALYDTLISRHTVDEVVAILAHEVGHYKKKHIIKEMIMGIVVTGVIFFILSLFIKNQRLFNAFQMTQPPTIYASLFFFGFLFTPINMALSVVSNILSRKYEYEADRYAVTTFSRANKVATGRGPKPWPQPPARMNEFTRSGGQAFIESLKKLTVDNLSNLTPHPLMVYMEYSHPPILERIKAIRQLGQPDPRRQNDDGTQLVSVPPPRETRTEALAEPDKSGL